jgi:hypothetical protein
MGARLCDIEILSGQRPSLVGGEFRRTDMDVRPYVGHLLR